MCLSRVFEQVQVVLGSQFRQRLHGGHLSEEVRERILFGNAAELYGVEAPDRPWRERPA